MSDILIKGMKMPKGGNVVKLYLCSDGRVVCQDGGRIYQRNAQVLPPHGRLADIDASRDDFMQTVYSELISDGDNYRANRIIDAYDDALTIIEASN